MIVSVRRGRSSDAGIVGEICYKAFKALSEEHNFLPDFPNAEVATQALGMLLTHERIFDVVAEVNEQVVGSNFLDERNPISGLGPITVDPTCQNEGVGHVLMQAVMDRSAERGFAGIRLVQAAYHRRSLAMYIKLGFEVRELLACVQAPPATSTATVLPGFTVRPATADDVPACNRLCFQIHGHDRNGELADAVAQGAARAVERMGRLTGYASPVAFFGHAVGETNDDLKALIGAAVSIPGPGALIPASNTELMRWCLARGMRVTQTMTLMTQGLYNRPAGAWLPSVIY
ncbi:MAG: GNAT family N-acetyltransferase [Steroidobacteraceae bacterium]